MTASIRWAALFAMIICFGPANLQAQDTEPDGDAVTEWLKGLAGEWEIAIDAGGMEASGSESSRMIGRWLIGEITVNGPDGRPAITGILTAGFDEEKDMITATWVDSMQGNMWHYQGKLEGDVLTLSARGPNPQLEGGVGNYRDVYDLRDKDQKVVTSEIETADGNWQKYSTMTLTRKQ